MHTMLAVGDPGVWSSFWDYFYVFRVHLTSMIGDLEPIHYALIALAAIILWGITSRRS